MVDQEEDGMGELPNVVTTIDRLNPGVYSKRRMSAFFLPEMPPMQGRRLNFREQSGSFTAPVR